MRSTDIYVIASLSTPSELICLYRNHNLSSIVLSATSEDSSALEHADSPRHSSLHHVHSLAQH